MCASGERALGAAVFAEQVGHFWSIVATRPYLRARAGLAQCLGALGRQDEAIAHYQEILRLNPDDNQGVRYSLLARLVLAGQDDEAGALLERFGDEPSALWLYGRALVTFRREGSSPEARRQLRDALRTNRHAPGYLTGDREPDLVPPDFYSPGSREEAAICDIELGEAWRKTPGAAEWLRAHAPRRSGKRKRR